MTDDKKMLRYVRRPSRPVYEVMLKLTNAEQRGECVTFTVRETRTLLAHLRRAIHLALLAPPMKDTP